MLTGGGEDEGYCFDGVIGALGGDSGVFGALGLLGEDGTFVGGGSDFGVSGTFVDGDGGGSGFDSCGVDLGGDVGDSGLDGEEGFGVGVDGDGDGVLYFVGDGDGDVFLGFFGDGEWGFAGGDDSPQFLLQSTGFVTTGKQVLVDFWFGRPGKQLYSSSKTTSVLLDGTQD